MTEPEPDPERDEPTALEIHQQDQIDAMIDSINKVAHDIGAPDAVIKTATGFKLHPDLQRLLQEHPELLRPRKKGELE